MCGITGWIKRNGPVSTNECVTALKKISHRGPDSQKLLFWNKVHHSVFDINSKINPFPSNGFFGHARLSIIDLEKQSNQPFTLDGNSWIIFNGEIYNYVELRKDLEGLGHNFITSSDTEVLLRCILHYGDRCIEYLNGMWSFAFLDLKKQSILFSRDRYGKKPLFYYADDNQFVFGSEFKCIFSIIGEDKRKFNPKFARKFIENGEWDDVYSEENCYSGIKSIAAGTVEKLDLRSFVLSKTFYSKNVFNFSGDPNAFELSELVQDSVRIRLRSDVPVGLLVSGGVDSSIIAGFLKQDFARKVHFFAGDTGHGNDLKFSKLVSESIEKQLIIEKVAPDKNVMAVLKEMTSQYELPLWLLGNSIAVFLMYRAMKEHGLKVILDGTGGDEVFGGYFNFYSKSVVDDLLVNKDYLNLGKFIWSCKKHSHYPYQELLKYTIQRINERSSIEEIPLIKYQIFDISHGHLPSWLYMNDQNSMSHSMEARSPLLDYRLSKYVGLPTNQKFHKGYNKYLLRTAMPKTIPQEVAWRRDKQGFRWQPQSLLNDNEKEILNILNKSTYIKKHLSNFSYKKNDGSLIHNIQTLRMFCVALLDDIYFIQ